MHDDGLYKESYSIACSCEIVSTERATASYLRICATSFLANASLCLLPSSPAFGTFLPKDYAEFGNILNLAMVTRDDRDNYVVVAAWLDAHDQLIQVS